MNVGDVDYGALRLFQRGRRGLGHEQRRAQVGPDQVLPGGRRDLTHWRLEKRRRVVDQRIELAESLDRLVDQRRKFRNIEQIRLDERDGILALMVELGLQQSRFTRGCAIVQHDIRTGGVKAPACRGTYALGPSGDQHDFALQATLRLHC